MNHLFREKAPITPADQAPPAHPAMAAPGAAAPKAPDTSAIDAKFKGDKKAEYSYMVGMDVARGLTQIKDEIDLNIMVSALQASIKGTATTMTEAGAMTVRQEFVQKLQAKQMAKTKEEAEKNQKEGDDFLAKNKAKKGVKTTASGLQYEVVKEGSGPMATQYGLRVCFDCFVAGTAERWVAAGTSRPWSKVAQARREREALL